MSFQQQPPPPFSYGNTFSSQLPPVVATNSNDQFNRFLPPSVNGQHATPPPPQVAPQEISLKATLAPPLRQQVLTNGAGPGSSNNSSRTASPAFNQPLNSAYLPPQGSRPQAYGSNPTAVSSPGAPPPLTNHQPPSSQSNQGAFYPPAATNATNPYAPVPPFTNGIGQTNVAHLTANLQNVHLTNGPSTAAAPPTGAINQQQPPAANRVNGTSTFPPKPLSQPAAVGGAVISPTTAATVPPHSFVNKPLQQFAPQANQPPKPVLNQNQYANSNPLPPPPAVQQQGTFWVRPI